MIPGERAWQPVTLGDGIAPPAGAYSPAVRAGDFIFVSGQVPRDPKTGEVVGQEIETQTRQVITNVESALAAAGATITDIVSVMVHIAGSDLWPRFNAIYKELMPEPYPTRTVVGADLRGVLVEITVIAYAPRTGTSM